MAMFVHIAPARLEKTIRRVGLRPGRALFPGAHDSAGIYAFPVLPSHTLTHQWTREVLKWRREPLIGVRLRVPDAQIVRYARYNEVWTEARASAAIADIAARPDPRGWEVLLDAPVPASAIMAIYPLRGVVGWRHRPDAHERAPCGCPACVMRGEPGGRRLRAAYAARDRADGLD
ncbi:MAG: hypothetical protein NW203_11415 [Hyphomonadaceae bacterium]|nr:hypothetical protein [Hyphomonadaceae bacterium]